MAMITLKCPHCEKDRMTFDLVGYRQIPIPSGDSLLCIVAFCRSCSFGISFTASPLPTIRRTGQSPANLLSNNTIDVTEFFGVYETWPAAAQIATPLSVPEHIERHWVEAEKSRRQDAPVAAAIMYRLTLEAAFEAVHPSDGLKRRSLFDAINAAADAQKITPDLKAWAHHIRLVGNEAAHEGGSPAEIAELANLTEMVLVYLFELPDKVRRMREAADAKKAAG